MDKIKEIKVKKDSGGYITYWINYEDWLANSKPTYSNNPDHEITRVLYEENIKRD